MSYDPNTPTQPSYPPPPQNYGGDPAGEGYQNAPAYGPRDDTSGGYGTPPAPRNSLAVPAMVLGIVSLVLIWFPYISYLGVVCALVGLVLGIIALRRASAGAPGKGQAITGVVCSAVAIAILVAAVSLLSYYT